MRRDYRVYLEDILEAAGAAREFVTGMGKDELAKDRRTRDAVVRNLEIIGEAVKKLPPQTKRDHPEVEWKKIAGLRDILVHDYFGIDMDIVWDVVQNKLPVLVEQVRRILEESKLSPGRAAVPGPVERPIGPRNQPPVLRVRDRQDCPAPAPVHPKPRTLGAFAPRKTGDSPSERLRLTRRGTVPVFRSCTCHPVGVFCL